MYPEPTGRGHCQAVWQNHRRARRRVERRAVVGDLNLDQLILYQTRQLDAAFHLGQVTMIHDVGDGLGENEVEPEPGLRGQDIFVGEMLKPLGQ